MIPTLRLGSSGDSVRHLQTLLSQRGYQLVVDGDFGPKTRLQVLAFQEDQRLAIDGVVGPKTWAALAAAAEPEAGDEAPTVLEAPACTPAPTSEKQVEYYLGEDSLSELDDESLARAGEIAAAEALGLWGLNIVEPPNTARAYADSRARIDHMIRSLEGLGWTWLKAYQKDGDFEWCLAFAATCWAKAGLLLELRKHFWSSTFRMEQWVNYRNFEEHSSGERPTDVAPRMVIELDENSKPEDCVFSDGTLPRAGDIVMVGPSDSKDYGVHGAVAAAYDPKTGIFDTIEGNAGSRLSGLGPRGDKREGVIKAKRKVGGDYCVRRVMRPSLADLKK